MDSFKTKVELEVYGILGEGVNYDVLTQTVEIKWDLQLEMRSWGVKDISMSVPEQKITVLLNIWGDNEDTEKEIVLDVKDVLVEKQSEDSSSLAPSHLVYNDGEWTLIY
jgi:hypothetical protein